MKVSFLLQASLFKIPRFFFLFFFFLILWLTELGRRGNKHKPGSHRQTETAVIVLLASPGKQSRFSLSPRIIISWTAADDRRRTKQQVVLSECSVKAWVSVPGNGGRRPQQGQVTRRREDGGAGGRMGTRTAKESEIDGGWIKVFLWINKDGTRQPFFHCYVW